MTEAIQVSQKIYEEDFKALITKKAEEPKKGSPRSDLSISNALKSVNFNSADSVIGKSVNPVGKDYGRDIKYKELGVWTDGMTLVLDKDFAGKIYAKKEKKGAPADVDNGGDPSNFISHVEKNLADSSSEPAKIKGVLARHDKNSPDVIIFSTKNEENEDRTVSLQAKYVNLYFKEYGDTISFHSNKVHPEGSFVEVRSNGKTVGIVMPIRVKSDSLESNKDFIAIEKVGSVEENEKSIEKNIKAKFSGKINNRRPYEILAALRSAYPEIDPEAVKVLRDVFNGDKLEDEKSTKLYKDAISALSKIDSSESTIKKSFTPDAEYDKIKDSIGGNYNMVISSIVDAATMRPSFFTQAGKDAGFCSDSRILIADKKFSDEIYLEAQTKLAKKLQGGKPYGVDEASPPQYESIMPKESAIMKESLSEPIGVYTQSDRNLVTMKKPNGQKVSFDANHYDLFKKRYGKDVSFHAIDGDDERLPIVARVNGKTVGLTMPIKEEDESKFKPLEQPKDLKKATLGLFSELSKAGSGEKAGHKYFKRIPSSTGKGWTYFYTAEQFGEYQKSGGREP